MFIMLLSIIKTPVLYAIYEYDKAFFIELFCVNKNRPQMKCDGQCKLAQMQQEKNEKSAGDILKQLQSETVQFLPLRITSLIYNDLSLLTAKVKFPLHNNHLYSFQFVSRLIKPPAIYQS